MGSTNPASGKALRRGEGQSFLVMGMPHIIKTASHENHAQTSIMEVIVAPGQGVPPHTHTHEDEFFCILDGELTCHMDGMPAPVTLRAGDLLFLPRNRMHGFTNATSKEARMMVTVTPGTGTDRMFAELAAACTKYSQPHELMPEAGRICQCYGVIFAPPPSN